MNTHLISNFINFNFNFNLSNSKISSNSFSPRFSIHQIHFSSTKNRILSKFEMADSKSPQNPVVQHQRIVIPNKFGENLVGVVHETGSKEIIVLCHGFRSTKNDRIMTNIAGALEKEGISAVRFDFSGNGESEGSFEFGNYYKEADDLHYVVDHFLKLDRLVSAILGHSKGGDVVLVYASKYNDIKNVVNLSGRYDLKRGIEERFGSDFFQKIKEDGFFDVKDKTGNVEYRVTQESLMDRLNIDMKELCQKIDKECSVMTVHGSADEVIPVEDAYEFDKIIPNHKLQIVEGANHNYTRYQDELAATVLDFIKTLISKN